MIKNISPRYIDKAIELKQHTRETNHKEKNTKCITLHYKQETFTNGGETIEDNLHSNIENTILPEHTK